MQIGLFQFPARVDGAIYNNFFSEELPTLLEDIRWRHKLCDSNTTEHLHTLQDAHGKF